MRFKDLTSEEVKILAEFETTEYYKVLEKWIKDHETHHALMALAEVRPGDGNDDIVKSKLVYRAGRLDEGNRILALSKKARDYLAIKNKNNG